MASWFVVGSLANTVFHIFPLVLLRQTESQGCLRDDPKNRITFLPVQNRESILYYSASNAKWDEDIKGKYNATFRVVPLPDLNPGDALKLCGDTRCSYFNTRYDTNNLVWLFLGVGYISVIDFLMSQLHNIVQLQEYRTEEKEVKIKEREKRTANEAKEEFELNEATSSQVEEPSHPRIPLPYFWIKEGAKDIQVEAEINPRLPRVKLP